MVEEQQSFKILMNRIKNRTLLFPTAKKKKAPNSVVPCKIRQGKYVIDRVCGVKWVHLGQNGYLWGKMGTSGVK